MFIKYLNMVAGYLSLLNDTDPKTRRFSLAVLCNGDYIKFSIAIVGLSHLNCPILLGFRLLVGISII